MNWRLATGRAWLLPVMWEAAEPEPAAVEATVVHVHYWLPAPDGLAITEGNQ